MYSCQFALGLCLETYTLSVASVANLLKRLEEWHTALFASALPVFSMGPTHYGNVIFMRSSLEPLLSKPALATETDIVRCLWSGVF